ncbi:unnamed protein product, partial [Pylaiella littoralis]
HIRKHAPCWHRVCPHPPTLASQSRNRPRRHGKHRAESGGPPSRCPLRFHARRPTL